MSDKLGQTPGAARRDLEDGLRRREDDDVEGHNLRREGEGIHLRRDVEGEGIGRRSAIPDDGDDVEGHAMMARGGDGMVARGEDFTKQVGPGEGNITRT